MARSQLFDPQAIGMPANQRQQTSKSKSQSQAPLSPTSKATAKYTNKDGSKFITVPKSDASEIPAAMNQSTTANGQVPTPAITNGVNKKKQKRREKEKEKARLASEQGGHAQPGRGGREVEAGSQHSADRQSDENGQFDSVDAEPYSDEDVYSGSYGQNGSPPNGYSEPLNLAGTTKSKKKKKGKAGRSQSSEQPNTNGLYHSHHHPPPLNHPPPLIPSLQTNMPRGPGISREKIWNTSSQEERERIKEFWLSLGEDERKSLVKVEKDAVLKKMKEQQKHSCSCTVCGRKRTAIEEELEVLYDAYYEELEQYANHQGDGITPMVPPPRRFGAMSGLQPPNRLPPAFNGQQPSRGRIVEQLGDDEDDEGDEEYSDEDLDDDEFSDEDPEPEEIPRSYQTDFFNFGNSLTVQGGILTVADDLLKNDGKKFIEMMEQLAERRMAREEDARDQQAYFNNHPPNGVHNHTHTHNHPPPPGDEEYDDEEDEEDYDSQDEDYDDEEEELDTMTEEQRMEEGRRMFQIFAARMFEQRVLTAYKEKVAKERQQKLIEELEEESRASSQKKAKKAKDAQKKKDKARQKKQADAEKAAEEAAKKAAEDAARLAAEEKAREEQREREETKRRKKEEQKKAQEAEKLKKEADKKRRADEAREIERKQREAKERKAAAAAAEREKREREEREIKERKAAAEREKREKDAKIKAEKEAKQREEVAAQQAAAKAAIAATQIPKRPLVPIPSNLQPQAATIVSPLVPVATPVVPKAPTPSRLRTASQQESSGSSVPQTPQTGGMSQNVSPVPTTPLHGSPGPIGPPGKGNPQPHLYHPQATSPMHAALKGPPGMQPNPFAGMPPLNMGFQPQPPMMGPGFGPRQMHFDPIFPHQQMGGQFRPMVGPNGMPIHPAMNMHHIPQGRGFPVQNPPPGFPQSPNGFGGVGQAFGVPKDAMPGQSHSRNPSASFEMPTTAPQAQPIARPAPIGRPSSVVNGQHQREHFKNEVDDLSNALGSSALIDDSDEPFSGAGQRRTSGAPGNMNRQAFPPTPFGMDQSTFASPITPWGGQGNPFGPSSLPSSNYMGGWPQSANSSFGGVGAVGPISGSSIVHPSQPRPAVIRSMICRACKILEGSTPDGFYSVSAIKEQIDHFNPAPEPSVSEQELVTYSSGTEGNSTNGGGYLEVREDSNGHQTIRHEIQLESQRPVGAPGEIGSPIISAGSGRFGPPPGF